MGDFIKKTVKTIEPKKTASEKLFALIQMHFEQLSESPYLAIVTQLELRQSKPELRYEINKVFKTYLDVIDEIVKQGITDNEIKSTINPQIIRQMIFGTLDETVTDRQSVV